MCLMRHAGAASLPSLGWLARLEQTDAERLHHLPTGRCLQIDMRLPTLALAALLLAACLPRSAVS